MELEPIQVTGDGELFEPENSADEQAFFRSWAPTSSASVKDPVESAHVAALIRARRQECWSNARKAILRIADYAEASYVEGWVVTDRGLVIEHGWIVRDGKIIDPTLADRVMTYFPGLEFKGRQGIADFLATSKGRECQQSPFFFAFGFGGSDSPSYCRAREEALAVLATERG